MLDNNRAAWDRWLVGSHREHDKPDLTAEQIERLETMRRRVASGELCELGLEQLRPRFARWLYEHRRLRENLEEDEDDDLPRLSAPGLH